MKKSLIALLLIIPLSTHAGIRTSSGQLISEGDSAAKLISYLGSPATKSYENTWCDRKKKSVCVRETWTYFHQGKQWTITIFQNEIENMEWTRR